MLRAAPLLERRRHPRAQLYLPVRLRWLGPLRTVIEITLTRNTARGGMLFHRPDECPVNARVWVTLPFDSEDPGTQPEMPARVVRAGRTPNGYLVALRFEMAARRDGAFNLPERRSSPRVPLSVPVRVRPEGAPWCEETMTLDVSRSGARLETPRLYSYGEPLRLDLRYDEWARADEVPAQVERVEAIPGAVEQYVAVAWTGALRPRMNTGEDR
jgi:hypothetical protein